MLKKRSSGRCGKRLEKDTTKSLYEEQLEMPGIENAGVPIKAPADIIFPRHIRQYIGETVTIFVKGGGLSGLGFTGILLFANDDYIKLMTRISPPSFMYSQSPNPSVAVKENKTNFMYKKLFGSFYYHFFGAYAYIPINQIASFVHNSL